MRVYVQTGPTTWAFVTQSTPPKRGDLPLPYVISDIMPPTEQVDGMFYTSKSEFRKVGRSHGLIEIGTEKLKPKTTRASDDPIVKRQRLAAIGRAISEYKAGRRV
jgi:hypothetical protein